MESECTLVRSRSSDRPDTSLLFTRKAEVRLGGSFHEQDLFCRNEILPGVGVGVEVGPDFNTVR
jgi:hypothetical protein